MLRLDEETRQMWARRARKERIKTALEFIGCAITMALFALLAWAFLAITPNQMSAECEAVAEELQR